MGTEKTITIDIDKVLDHKVSVSILKQFNSFVTIIAIFLTACGFMITLLWNTKTDISKISSKLESLEKKIQPISEPQTDFNKTENAFKRNTK